MAKKEFEKKYLTEYRDDVNHRYASFDFCYGYFRSCYNNNMDITGENMQRSCMILWSFLGSWGMLRGSSSLLQKSPATLKSVIEFIKNNQYLFEIDVPSYKQNDNVQKIIAAYKELGNI